MIELKHITKVFPTADGELTALNDVNITIHDGDVYGIVGMSGAGKSTLVRCINLLERPTSGQVVIDGKDLCVMPAKELHPAAPFHQHDLSAVQPAHAADLSEKYLFSHGDRRREGRRCPEEAPRSCWRSSACPTRRTPTLPSSPADRSSASPSPVPWPLTRRFCSATRPPLPWIPRPPRTS